MAKKKSLAIVIPIYNEEKELATNTLKLHAYLEKNLTDYLWQIIIADNASTDNSLQIAKNLSQKYGQIKWYHLDEKGRGRAVKTVWAKTKTDLFVYLDVDLSTDLKSLSSLLKPLSQGYDLSIGSRLNKKSKVVGRSLKREILSRVYNILIKILFRTHFSDAQCGFKAVTQKIVKRLIPNIKDNAWFFDSELLILAEKSGYKINEVPVYWIDNPGSTVRVLKTVTGDLLGLWRLFTEQPWKDIKNNG